MDRQDLVLAVLGAANGRGYSPAQLQKALFLISRNIPNVVDEGIGFNFRPYDYGPFDRAVYDEADVLGAMGLAQVEKISASGFRQYYPTDFGLDRASALLNGMPEETRNYVTRVCEWVRSLSFAKLVKSIYEEYPEMRANSVFVG